MTTQPAEAPDSTGGDGGSFADDLAKVVWVLMKIRGVSVQQAALAIGVSKASWYNRMRGDSEFTASQMMRLAELLQVEVGDLYRSPEELLEGQNRK